MYLIYYTQHDRIDYLDTAARRCNAQYKRLRGWAGWGWWSQSGRSRLIIVLRLYRTKLSACVWPDAAEEDGQKGSRYNNNNIAHSISRLSQLYYYYYIEHGPGAQQKQKHSVGRPGGNKSNINVARDIPSGVNIAERRLGIVLFYPHHFRLHRSWGLVVACASQYPKMVSCWRSSSGRNADGKNMRLARFVYI